MSRSYKLYLKDILIAIQRIDALNAQMKAEPNSQQSFLVDAILFNLLTIGEAIKQVPLPVRALAPEVAWSDIGRFRDFVIHHYFAVDMGKVLGIIQADLPLLRQQIEALLPRLPE